jgi:hypothetical protein
MNHIDAFNTSKLQQAPKALLGICEAERCTRHDLEGKRNGMDFKKARRRTELTLSPYKDSEIGIQLGKVLATVRRSFAAATPRIYFMKRYEVQIEDILAWFLAGIKGYSFPGRIHCAVLPSTEILL